MVDDTAQTRGSTRRRGPSPSTSGGRELWLQAKPAELSLARAFAYHTAAALGFGDAERFALSLAVSEAVANAIEHGARSNGAGVQLTAAEERDALVFYVRDFGSIEGGGHAGGDDLAERGRGLAVMRGMVDEVDLQSGPAGTVVRLAKRRPGPHG